MAPLWHFHSLEGHSRGPFTASCPLKEQPWGRINTNCAPERHPLPHFSLRWMGILCFINHRSIQKGRRYDDRRGNWVYSKTHGLFVFLCTYIRAEMVLFVHAKLLIRLWAELCLVLFSSTLLGNSQRVVIARSHLLVKLGETASLKPHPLSHLHSQKTPKPHENYFQVNHFYVFLWASQKCFLLSSLRRGTVANTETLEEMVICCTPSCFSTPYHQRITQTKIKRGRTRYGVVSFFRSLFY